MPISDIEKKAAKAVVNIFETGAALGDYGKVTVLPGDTGHLTYGRAQTTLGVRQSVSVDQPLRQCRGVLPSDVISSLISSRYGIWMSVSTLTQH